MENYLIRVILIAAAFQAASSFPRNPLWVDKEDLRLAAFKSFEGAGAGTETKNSAGSHGSKPDDASADKSKSEKETSKDKLEIAKADQGEKGKKLEKDEKSKEKETVEVQKPEEETKVTDKGTKVEDERCSRVKCTPAPNEKNCKQVHSVPSQLTGLTGDCCPVHACRRDDGSTFFHYAIEVEDAAPPPTNSGTTYHATLSVSGAQAGNVPPNQQFPPSPFFPAPFLPLPSIQAQPPSIFSFNVGRQPQFPFFPRGQGPPQGFIFPGPFGLQPLPPQQNIRVPTFATLTISDSSLPVERLVRNVGTVQGPFPVAPGSFQRQDVGGVSVPFAPGFDAVTRERRNVEQGAAVRPGVQQGIQINPGINF